jgi:hypothetical protein
LASLDDALHLGCLRIKAPRSIVREGFAMDTLERGGLMSQPILTIICSIGVIAGFLAFCHIGLATATVLDAIGRKYL